MMDIERFKALCRGAVDLENSNRVAADFMWTHILRSVYAEEAAIERCNRDFGHPSINRNIIHWVKKYREIVGCDTGEAIRTMKKLRGF